MKFRESVRRALGATALVLALAAPSAAQSPNANEAFIPQQQEEPAPQSSGGEAWYGYAAFSGVAVLALFLVCKSARRG